MRTPFDPDTDYAVPAALLNNVWRIVFQTTVLTHDDRRDLENLMSLVQQQSTPVINLAKD